MNELFSPAGLAQGGGLWKISTGMLVSLFGFEISQFVIFWVAQNEGYFYEVEKISSIFRLTGNLHYFGGVPEKKKTTNYFLEIDFHLLFCLFF